MIEVYDEDYYENGLVGGVSCYENYRWIPELTIPLAYSFLKHTTLDDSDRILDFGCAKGYLVKAFRLLGVKAFGVDISEYAVSCADPEVRKFVFQVPDAHVSKIVCEHSISAILTKDVLEHMPENAIDQLLLSLNDTSVSKMIHVIPLGDSGKFRIDDYHRDVTHIQIQNEQWWMNKFAQYGWKGSYEYGMPGIKDKWFKKCHNGDATFLMERL